MPGFAPMIAPHSSIHLDHDSHDTCGADDPGGERPGIACCDDHGREVSARGVDLPRIARAVREILIAVGEDPDREGLVDTPKRVAKAYAEIFRGLREDASVHLSRTFEQASGELITVTNVNFFSTCEHHLLPFHGQAHVAYLPRHGRVVGLSKLARTVEVFARRPQLQERLTDQIADALVDAFDAAGAVVMVEAEHMCMRMRGVRSHDARMTTFARRGVYRDDEARGQAAVALVRDLAHRGRG